MSLVVCYLSALKFNPIIHGQNDDVKLALPTISTLKTIIFCAIFWLLKSSNYCSIRETFLILIPDLKNFQFSLHFILIQ
jgi:hypothetical protein